MSDFSFTGSKGHLLLYLKRITQSRFFGHFLLERSNKSYGVHIIRMKISMVKQKAGERFGKKVKY
jgi:hypothetical protein